MPEYNDGIDAGAALVVPVHTFGRRPDFEAISGRERVHDFSLDESEAAFQDP
jgi:hypothetical protein